jgi:NitT/TauT family transport system substrate-binding protein
MILRSSSLLRTLAAYAALLCLQLASAAPLKVAYSDWPGWTAFEIAVQKNWFKDAGVSVEFLWFEYMPSMEAFTAGKVDAVMVTNGDALVTAAGGAKNTVILLTDYSNGNDMIVATPGIASIKDLKGKKIGLEFTLVEHLMLLHALKKQGLVESDVELVNTPTNQTPQVLASGQVSAIAAWYPNSGQALKSVAGSKAIYTSADAPGLIYDCVVVSPQSLSQSRADWKKFVSVWDRVVAYLADPKTREDGIKIMAARAGVDAKEYSAAMSGTRLVTLAEGLAVMKSTGQGFDSLSGSSATADAFNVKNSVYKSAQDIPASFDASLVSEVVEGK